MSELNSKMPCCSHFNGCPSGAWASNEGKSANEVPRPGSHASKNTVLRATGAFMCPQQREMFLHPVLHNEPNALRNF